MPYSYPSRHSLFSEILGDRLTTSKPHQSSCLHLHSAGVLGLQGVYLVPLWGTCPFIWIWAHSHVCTESALILWASHPDLFSAIPSIGSRLLYGLALVSSPHVIIQLLRSHLFREVCTDCHDDTDPSLPTKLSPSCFTFVALTTGSNNGPIRFVLLSPSTMQFSWEEKASVGSQEQCMRRSRCPQWHAEWMNELWFQRETRDLDL